MKLNKLWLLNVFKTLIFTTFPYLSKTAQPIYKPSIIISFLSPLPVFSLKPKSVLKLSLFHLNQHTSFCMKMCQEDEIWKPYGPNKWVTVSEDGDRSSTSHWKYKLHVQHKPTRDGNRMLALQTFLLLRLCGLLTNP